MRRNAVPGFVELNAPLPWYSPKNCYFKFISFLLQTAGRLSDGIRIGYDSGFDSGIIMNYIYENVPHGRLYIGKAIDGAFLNQTTCKAFRAIKQIQKDMIKRYLGEKDEKPAFIVDMASGKADYVYEVLNNGSPRAKALLRDINEKTLRESRRTAESSGLGERVAFELGDALDPESLRKIPKNPDLVIEVGLYGIIHDDERIKKHLRELRTIVNPGALLFNVQTYNAQIELIARALKNQDGEPCVWHLRPAEQVIGWAEEAGFSDPEITMDPYGIYAVVLMRSHK